MDKHTHRLTSRKQPHSHASDADDNGLAPVFGKLLAANGTVGFVEKCGNITKIG